MAQLRFPREPRPRPELQYVRAPHPLHFPEDELMPEGKSHLVLRTFLFQLLRFALGPDHSVGSEQFVYWNGADRHRCLAPDVFVKLGVPDRHFGNWKTWEHGAGVPELAVEIVSPSEGGGKTWDEKLAGYYECGVAEVVRFDALAPEGKRIRVWDRVNDDLVERRVEDDRTPCLALGSNWHICPVAGEPVGLRLVDDNGIVLLSELESEKRARDSEARARAEAEERARAEEARARVEAEGRAIAEARLRELEEELRRRTLG